MEKIFELAYRYYLETEDSSISSKKIEDCIEAFGNTIEKFKYFINSESVEKLHDQYYDSVCNVKEAAFITGFAYCAKLMTEGKSNIFGI